MGALRIPGLRTGRKWGARGLGQQVDHSAIAHVSVPPLRELQVLGGTAGPPGTPWISPGEPWSSEVHKVWGGGAFLSKSPERSAFISQGCVTKDCAVGGPRRQVTSAQGCRGETSQEGSAGRGLAEAPGDSLGVSLSSVVSSDVLDGLAQECIASLPPPWSLCLSLS